MIANINFNLLESIALGLGLGIAAGFRVFVPFLVLSGASVFGDLSLTNSLSWLDNSQVFIGLIVAVIFEILSYSIPWLDNITDFLAVPLAALAGTILMASTTSNFDPFLQWTLAITAGGGSAFTVKSLAGFTRLFSTATTGGLGNFLVAIAELLAAIAMTIFTLTLPLIGVMAIAIIFIILIIIWFQRKNNRINNSEVI